ncbi:prepilin peptidase [Candidatus Wolfebacteria bacterium]|nr:prepilin peptidase [Candidatus Wolfebacteria bacterium]
MYWSVGILFFVFGAIVGSFLNVVILRYNTGRRVTGRSCCHSCGRTLAWHELVPIASFLAQRGRCTACGSRISWQYPLVEFTAGMLFLGVFLKVFSVAAISPYTILYTLYLILTVSVLLIIAVYDLRHKIIPDPFVFAFIVLSFLWGTYLFFAGALEVAQWWLLAGPICAAPFALLWVLSRGRWMGLGDAKLAWGAGWFLGPVPSLSALLLAFWVGAVASVAVLIVQNVSGQRGLFREHKPLKMKSEIPFAPFIILGVLVVLFFGFDIRILLGL